jgi:hypothetical protein
VSGIQKIDPEGAATVYNRYMGTNFKYLGKEKDLDKYSDENSGLMRFYRDGVEVKTSPIGKKPATSGEYKPTITSLVDADGTPLYWDASSTQLVRTTDRKPPTAPAARASSAEREKTAGLDNLLSQLDRVSEMYKPEFVGVVSGRAGSVTGIFDAEEAGFRQLVKDIGDQLLRARSGAQINEQEYQRLLKIVPAVNDGNEQFNGKMVQFRKTLEDTMTKRAKIANQSGVRATPPKKRQAPLEYGGKKVSEVSKDGTKLRLSDGSIVDWR